MTERELWSQLQKTPEFLDPLTLEIIEFEPRSNDVRPDAFIRMYWGVRRFDFVAELQTTSTPRAFETAIDRARRYAEATSRLPLIVLPYLRPSQIDQLFRLTMSGMDLSGNGVVIVPDELLVYRTGFADKHRVESKHLNAYHGVSSLVGRALLARPEYPSMSALQREIARRGGTITQPTVSKAVARLEEDLLISRDRQRSPNEKPATLRPVRLLQADQLLDHLATNYKPTSIRSKILGKTGMSLESIAAVIEDQAATTGQTIAVTGLSSSARYSVMAGSPRLALYCTDAEPLLQDLPLDTSSRFPDLELRVTDDPTVYFDVRQDGLPWASPVQTYLEMRHGDPREQDTAAQVKQVILDDLRGWMEDEGQRI